MLLKVDFNEPLFRALFPILYDRVAEKALENGTSEANVKQFFSSLLLNSPTTLMLVDFDLETSKILAHCAVFFNQVASNAYTAFCDQMYSDSGHAEAFTKEAIAYVEAMPNIISITMATTEKKYKAFKKKYSFETDRVYMIKYNTSKEQE